MLKRILMFCSFMCVATLWAAPVVNIEYKTYRVSLADNRPIKSELNRASPIREKGNVFHGHTNWNTAWDFRWHRQDEVCRITRVTTRVDIVYQLPEALSLPTDNKMRIQYNSYYVALKKHEKGHGQFAIDLAGEIEAALQPMRSRGDCESLSESANSKAYELLEQYKQLDKQYDRQTGHGKTQGAYLE